MRACIILALATYVAAAAIDITPSMNDTDPLPEDEIHDPGLGWEGVIVPGQAPVVVWGHSFEDIEAQIRKDHPDFSIYTDEEQADSDNDWEFDDSGSVTAASEDPEARVRRALEGRADWGSSKCDSPNAGIGSVEKAIKKLKNIKGNKCHAKARRCTRWACQSSTGIGLCNRNTHQVNIACTHLARMAEHAKRKCVWASQWCTGTPNGCQITGTYSGGTVYSEGGTWRMTIKGCSWWGSSGSRNWVG